MSVVTYDVDEWRKKNFNYGFEPSMKEMVEVEKKERAEEEEEFLSLGF